MNLMNRITRSIALAGIVGSLALVACDNSDAPRADTPTPADRSAPRGNETTAMDQSNSSEHIDITASIRRAVMDDDALSTRARNVTIVTDRTGTVTLRGDVPSQAEKDAIAEKADAIVGSGRVVNQLVVRISAPD
jgi:hyperosmotically inducible periplasmic protein